MKKLIVLLLLAFPFITSFNFVPITEHKSKIELLKETAFSKAALMEYLDEKYSGYDKVILRQFILESGWFKSNRFTTKNNIAGMKYPVKRKTTAIGKDKSGYAIYAHWTDSVDDYFMWMQTHIMKGKDITNMYQFLVDVHYCTENGNYIKILKGIKLNKIV